MNINSIKKINDYISYLPCSENPLSADVYTIRGDKYTYVVDVGSCDDAYEYVNSIPNKKIIITHFHDDHMKNLARLVPGSDDLYVGNHTAKVLESKVYSENGVVPSHIVDEPLIIDDGIRIGIYPVPSSHAKGSLLVTVGDEYLFLGDSFYCSSKGYNVSLLFDEIRLLKDLKYNKVIMSHDDKIYSKEEIVSELESIYLRKEKNNPYISIDR